MARQKGSANFAGTLEVLAGGPLDARSQVPTKADLTTASNFPYPYVGMQVYVISEGKRYTLKAADVTVLANWEEEGGGGSSGGHTIEDPEGTALTQRDTLQFGGDLEVSDDDENEKTVVSPHELTVAELAEIVTPLPSVPVNMPILFDETGTERVVGWYKYANGTKKPVYEKTVLLGALPNSTTKDISHGIYSLDKFIYIGGIARDLTGGNTLQLSDVSATNVNFCARIYANATNVYLQTAYDLSFYSECYATLQYTKSTDIPS